MLTSLRYLDRVIRGDATRPDALRQGDIQQPIGGLAVIGAILGALYGLCMGSFAIFQGRHAPVLQLFATMLKVPVLFFLTILVTFPSLYVFNALVGSRLTMQSVLRLLIISLAVMLTVLASLGPIVAFFSASTTSYPFMLLLNVLIFAVSGLLGLRYMLITLNRLSMAQQEPSLPMYSPAMNGNETGNGAPPMPPAQAMPSMQTMPPVQPVPPNGATQQPMMPQQPGFAPPPQYAPQAAPRPMPAGALEPPASRAIAQNVKTVFRVWIVVFGMVGAQMAWVLRPFLGSPDHPFSLFRTRESNFFEAILYALQHLFR